jgi:hypothetical protein
MKQHYFKTTSLLMTFLTVLIGFISYAQDINFTFANAINTNDGSNDFYEVDVMIQTINSTGTFKLGSGQLYFTYSTTAFGENIETNGSFEVTQTNPDYICGQYIDAAAAGIYGSFTLNDNTTFRVSWAFSQAFSSSTFAADNITTTATKLAHIKVKYVDVNQDPMFLFENGGTYDDQFYTACGSAGGGAFDSADCGAFAGSQLVNDSFDSSGATLSNQDFELLTGLSIYPNPTKDFIYLKGDVSKLKSIEVYSILGEQIMQVRESFNEINISKLQSAMYFLKLNTNEASGVYRIVKQ